MGLFQLNYRQSIEFLYGLRLFGLKLGLENTHRLAALTGNPHHRLRFIHIAGTNGKGSVAAMLDSIYRAAGLRVGLYTSPHLVSFRERIQVNRQLISEAEVVRLVEEMQARLAQFPHEAHPTFFEVVTVMALQHFAEQGCELVIWETGLGGRLDATNIVTPLASVITNIEYDHQRWLGHDLASIAAEKAGILKPGVPTITATSEPEALTVIQETALAQHSPLTLVTQAHTQHPPLDTVKLPLRGWHQRMNAAVALATLRTLHPQIPVDDPAIRHGLQTVRWPGRLDLIERPLPGHSHSQPSPGRAPGPSTAARQRILLDGAHNASGATALRAAIEEDFRNEHPVLILGILADKDWDLMCEILAPVARRVLCVPVQSERSASPESLSQACRRTNPTIEVQTCPSLDDALRLTAQDPFVVIAGSLYLAGEALERLRGAPGRASDERGLNEWSVSVARL